MRHFLVFVFLMCFFASFSQNNITRSTVGTFNVTSAISGTGPWTCSGTYTANSNYTIDSVAVGQYLVVSYTESGQTNPNWIWLRITARSVSGPTLTMTVANESNVPNVGGPLQLYAYRIVKPTAKLLPAVDSRHLGVTANLALLNRGMARIDSLLDIGDGDGIYTGSGTPALSNTVVNMAGSKKITFEENVPTTGDKVEINGESVRSTTSVGTVNVNGYGIDVQGLGPFAGSISNIQPSFMAIQSTSHFTKLLADELQFGLTTPTKVVIPPSRGETYTFPDSVSYTGFMKMTSAGKMYIDSVGGGGGGDPTMGGDLSGTASNAQIVANAVGPTELASTAVAAGSYTAANITVDADGRITSAANGTSDPTMGGDLSGTASNAQIVAGAVGPTELASTAVAAGSYTNLNATIDADGRITSAANGTSDPTMGGDLSGTASNAQIVSGAVGPTELASTAVAAGSYTNAAITVDADGRLTNATNLSTLFTLASDFSTVTSGTYYDVTGFSFTPDTSSLYKIEIFGVRRATINHQVNIQLKMNGSNVFTDHALNCNIIVLNNLSSVTGSNNTAGGATTLLSSNSTTQSIGFDRAITGMGFFKTGSAVDDVVLSVAAVVASATVTFRAGFTILITKLA
jgi:hypothetical protein